MKHPDCFHLCSGNCRRVGCNCLCGEFHDILDQSELDEIIEDTTSPLKGSILLDHPKGNVYQGFSENIRHGLTGDISELTGFVSSELISDVNEITGNVSGLRGNLDDAKHKCN